ncbi:MAG: sulfite exporter TauE/SafE family protein [Polyangiaceae bacterium]
MRALHLENATQKQRPLFLFLFEMPDLHQGRYQTTVLKQWALVDWTDPTDPRFRGTYTASGGTVQEAIKAVLSSWVSGNRYPPGHVTFEIPPELRGIVGGAARRGMDTDGKNFTDQLIVVFEWIAIGAMTFAGFCFIFVAIPALTATAMATSILASTAGAVFSVQQRWRDGIFDWKADAIDGLTILSNVAGAGSWVRGARVFAFGPGGKALDFVFIGVRVGADAATGVLIVESRLKEVEELLDPTSRMPPEERSRKLLLVFAELSAVGLMTAMSLKASAKEAEHLSSKPVHLQGDPRSNVSSNTLERIANPKERIDTTKPPVAEGHTKEVQQKTTVARAVKPKGFVRPLETEFAKKYRKDGHPWQRHVITEDEIYLIDKDNFLFHAECKGGVLEITIITNYDPVKTPYFADDFPGVTEFKKSEVLSAKELYPLMYKHFEEVGKPVTRLEGLWAWSNAADAKLEYDKLIKTMSSKEAAKRAVLKARTFISYHEPQGFGLVIEAEYLPGAGRYGDDLFSFTIAKKKK